MRLPYFVVAALMLLFTGSVRGATYIIYVTSVGDGYYHNESGSSYDYFDSSSSSVNGYYTYWGTSDTLQQNTAYMQYSLSSLPTGLQITSATLNLYFTDIHYSSDSPSAGYIKHVANASSATGYASQKLTGTDTLVELKDQADGWLSIDTTSYVQADIDNGYLYSAFSGVANTTGYFRDAGFTFNSADSGTYVSYLLITAVPEPADVGLMLGLAVTTGVIVCRGRRRRG